MQVATIVTVKFSEDRKEDSNLLHAHVQPTSVCHVNIHHVKELILGNTLITVRHNDLNSGISVETIIYEHLVFKKVYTQWIPMMLMFDLKVQHVAVSTEHLHLFELEGNIFLEHIMAYEKTSVHYFTPESKWSSMEWHHKKSPQPKKFRTEPSADKIMASVFWDSEGVIILIFFHMV
jgi:hypothetical protein